MDDVKTNKIFTSEELVASLSPESRHTLNLLQENEFIPELQRTEESLGLFAIRQDYERAHSAFIEKIEHTPLTVALRDWLTNLSPETARNYLYYINAMKKMGLFPEYDANQNVYTVGHFNRVNHEEIIDWIKKVPEDLWKESTRQTHAACYISLTSYLERWTKGWFKKAVPNVSSQNKTFYQVHDKCVTNALTLGEWHRFIDALEHINYRDSLIARCILQGAKRISEVLTLKLDQVQWDKNLIRFKISKTGGTIKYVPITYPSNFMVELKEYIYATNFNVKDIEKRYIFVTRNGKGVTRLRLNYSFARASKNAALQKVTPHMLRATWVTLVKQQGIQDTEIMKVTGHTSSKMIYAYDKTSSEENISKKLILI